MTAIRADAIDEHECADIDVIFIKLSRIVQKSEISTEDQSRREKADIRGFSYAVMNIDTNAGIIA